MKVVVNGVSGWLGRATLSAIKRVDPSVNISDLSLISSNARNFHTTEYGYLHSLALSTADVNLQTSDIFIQLAFKTRDFISILGEREYEKINMENSKNMKTRNQ
jgi:hypothetical protein